MPEIAYQDQDVIVEAYLGLGRMGNNCYVLRPTSSGPVTVVDAPEGIEEVLNALGDTEIERTVVTHSHRDHWYGFDVLGTVTEAPVFVGGSEIDLDPSWNAQPLEDGDVFAVGDAQVQVIATPGHTPGSICLLVGKALLTGDTLFPGGPGRTKSHEDFETEVQSITSRLHVLESDTIVLPGHGTSTTIEASRAEYEAFAAKDHDADLHGDVLWAES